MSNEERREFERLQRREEELIGVIDMLRETLAGVTKQNEELHQLIKSLEEQIASLTAQLDQKKRNSHNSSKPPSSDGYAKPNPQSLRPTDTGKKAGGQPGHQGKSLKIEDAVDQHQPHYPSKCENCPHREECNGRVKERRYEVDVEVRRNVVCHEQMEMECPLSGETLTGEFPKNVTGTKQYGSNLQAFAVGLNTVGAVSIDRISQIFKDFFNIPLATGTVQNFIDGCATDLKGAKEFIFDQVAAGKVINADETGARVGGRLGWFHSYSSGAWVYYAYNRRRGQTAMDDIGFLPILNGSILVHDFWSPYFKYRAIEHAMCCAHLERELVFAYETTKQEWAEDLMKLLIEINAAKLKFLAQGKTGFTSEEWAAYEARYDACVREGLEANPLSPKDSHKRGKQKKGKTRCLLERFQDYKTEILRFATDWDVPFTNNEAEQNIRFTKVKVKVAGCFRSEKGAENFATIMSYAKTASKHGIGFFSAIRDAIMGNALSTVKAWA